MLYVTLGLPRSGKSTLAGMWANYEISFDDRGRRRFFFQEGNNIPRRVRVSPDNIRLALGHRFNWNVEPFVHATAQVMVKSLLVDGYDVLVDCTNTTEESLAKWFYIEPNTVPIVVDTAYGECIARARQTNQADLIPVIERMHNNMLENFGHGFSKLDDVVARIKSKVSKNASVGVII